MVLQLVYADLVASGFQVTANDYSIGMIVF